MAVWDKQPLIVIGGPTASGKTAASILLAQKFNGEIICADSMQIYKKLDIGTAKVTQEEMQGIPHHMVGILEPDQIFSVADYVKQANFCIQKIVSKGKLPLLVGGTGLYIESLVSGVEFHEQKPAPEIRNRLEEKAAELGKEALHAELARIDPEYAKNVHPNNTGRVIRALELYYSSGITMSEQRERSLPQEPPYNALVLCMDWPREILYQRIDVRVDMMLGQGLLREAEMVWKNAECYKTAAQAIGYKEFFPYFEEEDTLENCVAKLKQSSRNYAKRQLTWFRRMKNIVWIDAQSRDALETAADIVKNHLGK